MTSQEKVLISSGVSNTPSPDFSQTILENSSTYIAKSMSANFRRTYTVSSNGQIRTTWLYNLYEDKFELMVHKDSPQSLLYELPFNADEMSYKVSTGDVLYPESHVKVLGISIHLTCHGQSIFHINTMCARDRSALLIKMVTIYTNLQ